MTAGNGQRATGSGQRSTGNGQRATGNGSCRALLSRDGYEQPIPTAALRCRVSREERAMIQHHARRRSRAFALLAVGALATQACATKGYVRKQVAASAATT